MGKEREEAARQCLNADSELGKSVPLSRRVDNTIVSLDVLELLEEVDRGGLDEAQQSGLRSRAQRLDCLRGHQGQREL